MMNLEIRIRNKDEARARPLAEIPFREEVIENVLDVIGSIGGYIGGTEIDRDSLSFQFADNGEKAFLEVIVE